MEYLFMALSSGLMKHYVWILRAICPIFIIPNRPSVARGNVLKPAKTDLSELPAPSVPAGQARKSWPQNRWRTGSEPVPIPAAPPLRSSPRLGGAMAAQPVCWWRIGTASHDSRGECHVRVHATSCPSEPGDDGVLVSLPVCGRSSRLISRSRRPSV